MVVSLIKWRPRPPLKSRKFNAAITIRCLKGATAINQLQRGLTAEIRWKGSKVGALRSLSRKVKKDRTREGVAAPNGVVLWEEEFTAVCTFSPQNTLWEVSFTIFNVSDRKQKKKIVVAGPAVLNLAEFASIDDEKEIEIPVPLASSSSSTECSPILCLIIRLTEPRTNQEPREAIQRSLTMPLSAPLSPCFGFPATPQKEEASSSTLQKSLRKVKSLTEYVSSRRKSKKAYHGEASSDSKFSTGSENSESNYPFDTDSLECSDEVLEEIKEDSNNVGKKTFGYGTLVSANLAGGVFDSRKSCEDEDLVYYSNRTPEADSTYTDDMPAEGPDQTLKLSPRLGILAWKKRKLSFRSPKVKGEPLLKKEYGDSGGDDIDFDRRLLTSSDELSAARVKAEGESLSISEFGDDSFAVGSWECKDVVSRDRSMKLRTKVFFATIDQMNEKAAGESACTALVAVIADWIQSNPGEMPTRSEFDALIREGSLQWRNLCEINFFIDRFPDKHLDLETVIQAKIRPISEVSDKSFIGFFHPEGMEDEEELRFLHGAMSFDSIWDEITDISSECATRDAESLVYIVSWNDHFFVLKIDADAYYIIDTLGERLFEGCDKAYVLKFDKDTTIHCVPIQPSEQNEKSTNNAPQSGKSSPLSSPPTGGASKTTKPAKPEPIAVNEGSKDLINDKAHEERNILVCKGKETCREYIKSFLAAIPIREVQADIRKKRIGSVPHHRRLQIEFHHIVFLPTPTTTTTTTTTSATTT